MEKEKLIKFIQYSEQRSEAIRDKIRTLKQDLENELKRQSDYLEELEGMQW